LSKFTWPEGSVHRPVEPAPYFGKFEAEKQYGKIMSHYYPLLPDISATPMSDLFYRTQIKFSDDSCVIQYAAVRLAFGAQNRIQPKV
jgi:hypothetical protein